MDPFFVVAGLVLIVYGVITIRTRKQNELAAKPRRFITKALYTASVRGRLGIALVVCGIILVVGQIIMWLKNLH